MAQAEDYDHKIKVEKMSVEWKVEGKNLNMRLSAKTTGWVGIGFNPTVVMRDANFILAYVKEGKVKVTDEFGISDNVHSKDSKHGGTKDVTVISGTEEKGLTTISLSMPLESGDEKDRSIKIDGDTTVILAYGASRDSFKSRHTFKAVLKVNLSTGKHEAF
jgi:hypothetical protein